MRKLLDLASLRCGISIALEGAGMMLCFALLYCAVITAYVVTGRA